jgi:hypothetical protein
VNAQGPDLLINGTFEANQGGWTGASGGASCNAGQPSLGEWYANTLTFSHEMATVSQDVVIPNAGEVVLTFTGMLSEGGGQYSASLADSDETVSTETITEPAQTEYTLSVVTQSEDETVTVSFSGVDSLWWAGCYGPIISNASLHAQEPAPVETTTTTTTTEPPAPDGGLSTTIYTVTNIPPTISDNAYQQCGQTWYENIYQTWDSAELHVGTCGWDQFMAHYQGFINIPEHETIEFVVYSDDGSHVEIEGQEPFGLWADKGCSPSYSGPLDIAIGQYSIDAWMYENGGGTCFYLYWSINSSPYEVVPASAFTGDAPEPAKSLGAPLNVNAILTDEGVLLTWEPSTDDVGVSPERYSVSWSTGGSGWGLPTGNVGDASALNTSMLIPYEQFEATGGLNMSYQFSVRADNDSEGIYSQTTPTEEVIVLAPSPTTTTTEIVSTTTTITPTTIEDNSGDNGGNEDVEEDPVDESAPPSSPENEVPQPEADGEAEEETPETPVDPAPEEQVDPGDEPVSEPEPPTEEPGPEDTPTEELPIEELPVEEIMTDEVLEELSPEEIAEVVDTAIEEGLSADEAAAIATSAKALQSIDGDQASEVFGSLDVDELTDSEVAEVVSAVQDAPTEVREAFEEEINIFGSGGAMDTYVPVGSQISVGERRVLIAASGIILAGGATAIGASSSASGGSSTKRKA